MKKAYELSTLTGTQVLLLVVSETGLVYTFTTAKLQPLVTQPEGKNLIQACLNAPQGSLPSHLPVGTPIGRTAASPHQPGPPAQQIPPPPPPNPAQQPGQAPPPHMQPPRNVPGGLSIGEAEKGEGDAPGSSAGTAAGEDGDEGDKRGAPRRRTSKSGTGRSPTSPHAPHLAIPGQQQGPPQPQQQQQPPMAGYPPPPDGSAPMYHPAMMGYPAPYPQQMQGGWPPAGAPPPGGQQYAARR